MNKKIPPYKEAALNEITQIIVAMALNNNAIDC